MNPIYKFALSTVSYNLMDPTKIVRGLINIGTGILNEESTFYKTTDYIRITPNRTYKFMDNTNTIRQMAAFCFYTENFEFISGRYAGAQTAPANAYYMRGSFAYTYNENNCGVFLSGVAQFSPYGSELRVYPIYGEDLQKEFEKESGQEFFRQKLSGELVFSANDYNYIASQNFDHQFVLLVYISYDAGQSWTQYWRGRFWKTDCKFDDDEKKVTVTPSVVDQYNDVISGQEKEFNLLDYAPEIIPVVADKRPLIQVYVPGESVIGCFLSGMWWEQECEQITDGGALVSQYHFALNREQCFVETSGTMTPVLPELFIGDVFNPRSPGSAQIQSGGYVFEYYYVADSGGSTARWTISNSGGSILWEYVLTNQLPPENPTTITLTPVSGSGATGNVTLYIHNVGVYARYLLDVDTLLGNQTFDIPADDIVENNRNYHKCIGYNVADVIYFSTRFSSSPTKWGLRQPGQYYEEPYLYWSPVLFPVARNSWGAYSIWFAFSSIDWTMEESGRAQFIIKNAYPLASAISILLAQIAPNIQHSATTEYSQFLYGVNPITNVEQTLLITPKSNIISSGYDQPAQKAPITLKSIFDMLRDCFRCYWFIDSQNRLRIEHISYFMNGGTYMGTPVVGIDLTQQTVSRSGKQWAFGLNKFQYNKPDMASRYQFGWMDNVTTPFKGLPIDILSGFVNAGKIEEINVANFTSDVDYILLNPSAISKDGFAFLVATTKWEFKQIEFEQGGVSVALNKSFDEQNFTAVNDRIRTNGLIAVTAQKVTITQIGAGYYYGVHSYDENLICRADSGWLTGTNTIQLAAGTKYIFIVVRKSDNSEISVDDAAYFTGTINGVTNRLPYITIDEQRLQNGYAAFAYLQQYYAYDMPAPSYKIGNDYYTAQGIKRLKTQDVSFPAKNDPDMVQLVKTNLGDGMIQKLSVNLSSRNVKATLNYDTE